VIELDFRAHIPIYVQIIDQIQERVDRGALKPGDQLPTVRQLADELEVNFNTVARAYRLLDEAGVISTQHGRGTFVLEPGEEPRSPRRTLEELVRSLAGQARRMGYAPEEVAETVGFILEEWDQTGDV
jgi:GntR family transcriptional regulator